jgi:hypothetical protein
MRQLSLLLLALAAAPAAAQPTTTTPRPLPNTLPPNPASPAPAPTLAPPANTIRGAIVTCDCARGEHRVRLEGGRRYSLSVTSRTFDPKLQLLRVGVEQVLAEDDDSGGGVTPRLSFTPPATADYLLRVSSALPGGVGEYSLDVQPAAPLPPLVVRPARIERGESQIFDGNLAAGSFENGRRYQDYELRLTAGQAAMIHVLGLSGLDTALQIFSLADRGNRPLAQDDDGGGGANPFVYFAPAQPGTYVVRVIGADAQAQGTYRLRISR